jgi:gentisate 1,2-dioxygenase
MLHFTRTLSLDEAERRVLMLVNPGMLDLPATVNSLFAGIQVILPGETAQAHRHTASAFRFIIEGASAYTTVDGERMHRNPGDLLLTPGCAGTAGTRETIR